MSEPPIEYIELNLCNYDEYDVSQLNEWGTWAVSEIERLKANKDWNSIRIQEWVNEMAELKAINADLKNELTVLEDQTDDYRKTLQEFQGYDGDVGLWGVLIRERDGLRAINAELLATLEAVLSRGCMLKRVSEIEKDYVAVPHPETMDEVKAAIAKAKGGE